MSSYWLDSIDNKTNYNKINENYECDVCIIGAGITGLTCGYYLSKLGLKVIIVEKDTIGQKASGNTTGKITYQHNLIYDYLIKSYGDKYAKAYLDANKEAISNIKNIVEVENIDCDFEFQSNYVYTTKQEEITKINAEIQALHLLGEDCELVTSSPLPFKIAGGIENKKQAQFNPALYMVGLANCITNCHSLIFCNSTASDFKKEDNSYVTFVNGYQIKSSHIIIASHYPFPKLARFLFYKNVSIYFLCLTELILTLLFLMVCISILLNRFTLFEMQNMEIKNY